LILKIGELVRAYVPKIIEYCEEIDQDEIGRLQNLEYSKDIFGISSYPFWLRKENITKNISRRFWNDIYVILEDEFRVSSQWTVSHIEKFQKYLINKNIVTKDELDNLEFDTQKANDIKLNKRLRSNSRYKGNAIGNAQNLVIRNILSNLGDEAFNENDWKNTKEFFNNECAYCGSKEQLVMEHAIPINKTMLGEHRLGNIVPSCNKCNKEKASQSYDTFLKDASRLEKIETYMKSKKYEPLGSHLKSEIISEILKKAYLDTAEVAKRYIEIIELIQNKDTEE